MHSWLPLAFPALLYAWSLAQVIQLSRKTALGSPVQTQLNDGKRTVHWSHNARPLIKVQP